MLKYGSVVKIWSDLIFYSSLGSAEWQKPEYIKPGVGKAWVIRTRNEKSRNLWNPEWEKPDSLKPGMRRAGIFKSRSGESRSFKTRNAQARIFKTRNGKSCNLGQNLLRSLVLFDMSIYAIWPSSICALTHSYPPLPPVQCWYHWKATPPGYTLHPHNIESGGSGGGGKHI